MNTKLLSLFGLKFHPFRPEIPIEALHTTPPVDSFCARVEFTVGDLRDPLVCFLHRNFADTSRI